MVNYMVITVKLFFAVYVLLSVMQVVYGKTHSSLHDGTLEGFKGSNNKTSLTNDDIHKNIMKHFHKDYIINSTDIIGFLDANLDIANKTSVIYVADHRKFILTSSISTTPPNGTNLAKRQCASRYYTTYWVAQNQWWWDQWEPASGCIYTGYDPAGATITINYGWSQSIAVNGGLDWNLIVDTLSASVGFTVTTTNSRNDGISCNIPGYSVGQIWYQQVTAWGWYNAEDCVACDSIVCGDTYYPGSATAPAKTGYGWWTENLGCSTGSSNVRC